MNPFTFYNSRPPHYHLHNWLRARTFCCQSELLFCLVLVHVGDRVESHPQCVSQHRGRLSRRWLQPAKEPAQSLFPELVAFTGTSFMASLVDPPGLPWHITVRWVVTGLSDAVLQCLFLELSSLGSRVGQPCTDRPGSFSTAGWAVLGTFFFSGPPVPNLVIPWPSVDSSLKYLPQCFWQVLDHILCYKGKLHFLKAVESCSSQ